MNTLMNKLLLSAAILRSPNEGGAPNPPPDEGGDEASLRETLAFDPGKFFTPQAKEVSDEGGEGDDAEGVKEGSADGAASSQQAEPPPSKPTPEPAKKEGEEPDPMAELRKAVQGFLSTKPPEPKAEPQPAEPAKPAPTETSKEPEKVEYNFSVPDEVVDRLGHEEPAERRKAVNALVNGLANKLAKDFGAAMAEMAKTVRAQAVQDALSGVDSRTHEQKVRDDFYGNNEDLKELVDNLPQMDRVVWETAAAVAAHTGQKTWSKELREQTANLLRLQLKLPPPKAGAKSSAQGNGGRAPRKPAFSAGGGGSGDTTRSNGEAGGNDFQAVLNAGTG